jgi:DNA-directed RNA polymerase specialized sigma24 family protein
VAQQAAGVAVLPATAAQSAAHAERLDTAPASTTMGAARRASAMNLHDERSKKDGEPADASPAAAPRGATKRSARASKPTIDPGHAEHVTSPDVQRAIASQLQACGVAPKNVPDAAQDVTLELLVKRNPPADMAGCLALARHIARQRAIDHLRKNKRRGKYDVGLTDTPDDHTAADHASPELTDPLDRKKQLELIEEKRADGSISEKAARILELDAQGLSAVEVGKEVNLAPQTVRNTLSAVKRELRVAWAKRVGSVLGALCALWLIVWAARPREDQVASPPPPEPSTSVQSAEPQGTQEAQRRGAELRERAIEACKRAAFDACRRDLDDARTLDPAGEAAPRVQAARRAIRDGRPLVDDGAEKR